MKFKILLLSLLVFAGAAAFAGGSADTAEPAMGGAVVIDAFVTTNGERPDFSPEVNRLTAWLMEEFDVQFDFVAVPGESAADRQALLMAAGDYPSVFFHGEFSKTQRMNYGRQGVFKVLNDLIADNAPNVQGILNTDPDYAKDNVAPDGNIYALAGAEFCYHCSYTPKIWINYDWLDALGLDLPTTNAEFEEVLVAFKTQDPNGNGIADEIPFSGAQQTWHMEPRGVLISPFTYVNIEDYMRVENGRVRLAASEDAFRDGIRWAAGLYEQGLIDPQSFTQNEDSFASLAQNPDVAILGSYSAGHQLMGFNVDNPERWNQYYVLPPLEGPNGHRVATYRPNSYSEAQFAITNKATEEVTRKALEIVDFGFTPEGAITYSFGPRGFLWDWPDEGDLGMFGQPAVFETDFTREEPGVVASWAPPNYFDWETFSGWSQIQDIDVQAGYERRLALATDEYAAFTPDETLTESFWMSEADADTYATYRTEFKSYIDQNVVLFITGQRDIDSDWDEYIEGLQGLGLDSYLELVQEAYDATR